jgi:hypothetical protein
MGQAKKRLMEYEYGFSIIDRLISIYSSNVFDIIDEKEIIYELIELKERIRSLDNNSMDSMEFISDLLNDDFHFGYSNLSSLHESIESNNEPLSEKVLLEIKNLTKTLQLAIHRIKNQLNNYFHKTKNIYNSEHYYNEQINELENEKNRLQEYLIHQKNIEGKSQEEIAENKRIIQEKEISLLKAKEQIKQYQSELEKKKKSENAIVEWDSKIKSTFEELTECLSPVKDEHTRLNHMFWLYSILTVLVVIIIVSLEFYIFNKLHDSANFPSWKNYFAAITPIPVFGGLLWAFIIQSNRTQRQLLIIAKHIHEIKYIEGLLLSINSLSLNINESTERVNNAINRLLQNHLNRNSISNEITEETILKEENKDSVPIDIVLKLLKEAKGIVSK